MDLDDWALGFLFTEGIISEAAAVELLAVDPDRGLIWADVRPNAGWDPGAGHKRYLTSGCGKGVTFSSLKDAFGLGAVEHQLTVTRGQIAGWMRRMQGEAVLYRTTGGMHACAVVQAGTGELVVREDIGRHNAVDKAIGAALRRGWDRADLVILTSGRISYEMAAKIARLGVAVGASRTAATDQAVRLANRLGMELCGYCRGTQMVMYTAAGRVVDAMPAHR